MQQATYIGRERQQKKKRDETGLTLSYNRGLCHDNTSFWQSLVFNNPVAVIAT
jgi:hypothetical protein